MKKVLLIVVDACASRVVVPAIKGGQLPNLRVLAQAGLLHPECTSIFPSLTPAANASIITGRYPQKHNILGFHWYDLERDEVVYYGDDFWIIASQGFGNFFEDLVVKLNHQRLQADTLFQIVERAQLKSASLNYFIFRGDVKHRANVPFWLSLLPGISFSEELYGPSMMYFGDLIDTSLDAVEEPLNRVGGVFHRFGFEDDNTADLLIQLAKKQALPDFTAAYFPDNDFESHKVGPKEAVPALERLDSRLGELFEVCGGVEKMLAEFCIILTGDHSQTDIIADEEEACIRLDKILSDFTLAKAGKPWQEGDQLMICPEMRTGQIYLRHPSPQQFEHVVALLLADRRIDQVIWRAKDLDRAEKGYYVATLERGRLRFWPGVDGPQVVSDSYGCAWSWAGELSAVDGEVSADNLIDFPTYPNAFERIVGALNCKNSGHIWITARPGYEFSIAETRNHIEGGSHGSLHVLDSTSPLLVAGLPEGIDLPVHFRSVDIAPLCLMVLGLEPEYALGESRLSSFFSAERQAVKRWTKMEQGKEELF